MKFFLKKFGFRESGKLLVGIERECFLIDEVGEIVPRAAEILKHFPDRKRFGYELSACQFEDRIGPVKIEDVKKALLQNECDIKIIENRLGFQRLHVEVAPEAIPLNIYPDPRKCWNLIRISVHGTIEFRMFGATPDLDKIVQWAKTCHRLCQEAMET